MSWQITGRYMETCNCDFICPCPLTGMAETTHGSCTFAMAFSIESGKFEGTSLDGQKFVIVGRTPSNMGAGNWEVGVIVDDTASDAQQQAIGAIAGGQAGGPMANIAPLIGAFKGIEARPIQFQGSEGNWSVVVPDRIDQAVTGVRGLGGDFLALDGTGHPVSNRLNLGHADHSSIHAFGIDYDETSGRNNGHFAPFDWRG